MKNIFARKLMLIVNVIIKCTFCDLKDLGEVTNFTEFMDNDMYRLGGLAIKKFGMIRGTPAPLTLGGLGTTGGQPALLEDFAYSVIFLNYKAICAGVIISDKIVLTCAHCLDHSQNLLEMRIYAGSRFLFDQTADTHMVWDFVIHGRYNEPIKFANDVALVIIHDKFRFKPTVQKAHLVNHRQWMVASSVIRASGWGETENGQKDAVSKRLQSIELKFLPYKECAKISGTALSPDMFCSWGDGKRATCRGDSGGGAVWNGMVVGIVSHGGACPTHPGIYINVYYLRPWIETSTKKLYHKFCHFHDPQDGDY